MCCACVLAATLVGTTLYLSGEDWDVFDALVIDQCMAPTVVNGNYHGTGEWSNSDALSVNEIKCAVGYHRTAVEAFSCACKNDGEQCGVITNACVDNGCTVPSIADGWYDPSGWKDLQDGDPLDTSKIHCTDGWRRSSVGAFYCVCEEHESACSLSPSKACEEIELDGDSPDNDNGSEPDKTSSGSGMPTVVVVILVVADLFAIVVLTFAIWLVFDYRDKKRSEKYFEAFRSNKVAAAAAVKSPASNAAGVPIATAVGAELVGAAVPGPKSPVAMLAAGKQAAVQARALESSGRVNDAIRLYKLAVSRLTTAIEGMPTTDESYAAVSIVEGCQRRLVALSKADIGGA